MLPALEADVRILPEMSENGECWRRWEEVIRAMRPAQASEGQPPEKWKRHLTGAASAPEALSSYRRAGGPLGHHREWTRASKVEANKPQIHEHFLLMLVLEMLGCVDQLNLGALLGVEILMRRAQLIESAFELAGKGGAPDFFHADDMMGLFDKSSGVVIAPTLEKATAERLKARAEIAKEIRKAKTPGGKGKGKEHAQKGHEAPAQKGPS